MAFTDNFNGEASNVDLASHVPSGGTAWTRVDGSVNMGQVSSSTNRLINNTSNATGALYQCDDQGSANHYLQYVASNTNIAAFICNRASANTDYIGIRIFSSKVQIWKRVGGTLTQLGADGTTTVSAGATIRLESSGNTHTAFINGTQEIQRTDSHNSTVTRQGVNARSAGAVALADDIEFGSLSGATTHDTSGALTAGSAVVAGSAAHVAIHGTSGALTAGSATVSGSASRTRVHATDGALAAGSAVIAGAATRFTIHATSGALTAGAATVSGSATRFRAHATDGSLVAGSAAIAGAADHASGGPVEHATSGALVAGPAVVAGSAAHIAIHDTSGTLVAGSAQVFGSARRTLVHDTSGALQADSATVEGAALTEGALSIILKILRNKQVTYPIDYPDDNLAGKLVIYDDDGVTPLYSAPIFEDADAMVAYRMQGIQYRGKLE